MVCLFQNKDIVICKPDKGSGVVVLNKADYEWKMLQILNDDTKFCQLCKLPQRDKTAYNERKLQSLWLPLKKSNEINDDFYQQARPTGSERPRMYGLPRDFFKTHSVNDKISTTQFGQGTLTTFRSGMNK